MGRARGGCGCGVGVGWVWGVGKDVWKGVCGGGLLDQCSSERWQEWVYVYHCVWDPDPVRLGSRV